MMRFLPLAVLALAAPLRAQTVSAARAANSGVSAVVLPANGAAAVNLSLSPVSSLGLTPSLSAPSIALSAPSLAAPALVQAGAVAAAPALVPTALNPVRPAAAIVSAEKPAAPALQAARPTALSVLSAASVDVDKRPGKLDETFDGSAPRADAEPVVAASSSKRPSFLGRAALAAGVFVANPGIAIAQAAPKMVEPGFTALVTNYAPLAVAIAAVIGALVGLWASRAKDGSPANAGQVFSSAMSYGAIAGGVVFALIDLTKYVFLGGAAVGLAPLTAAVATAGLAQAAFAAKFTDPTTTPADRIVGAFPAVAAAFGLSVGAIAFLPAVAMLSWGTTMLMITGAATALYVALFRPEKSPATGPAQMGRGFTLQATMTGLAVALGTGPYALFFFALGSAGFAMVLWATAKELWAAVPPSWKGGAKKP